MSPEGSVRLTRERARRIALDTNILIYHLEDNPAWSDFTTRLFDRIETGRLNAIVSALALHEILTGVHKAGFGGEARRYENLMATFPNLSIVPFDSAIASISAELRARYGLRTPDAVHIATAIHGGAEAFVTNDETFRRVKEIRIRFPGDRIP